MHSIFAHCTGTASVLAHADWTQPFIPQPLFKSPRPYTDLTSVCMLYYKVTGQAYPNPVQAM